MGFPEPNGARQGIRGLGHPSVPLLGKAESVSLVFFVIWPGRADRVIGSWLGHRVAYFSKPCGA
jgi:hypothetical protein